MIKDIWVVVLDQDYYPDPRYFSTKEKAMVEYNDLVERLKDDGLAYGVNSIFIAKIDNIVIDEDSKIDIDFWC